jgi:ketosteroid isomerase-like protein
MRASGSTGRFRSLPSATACSSPRRIRASEYLWSAPDPARIPGLVAPDVTARFPGTERPVEGMDAYRDQIAGALAAAPDLRLEVLDHLAEGDRVVIEWRARCTVGGGRVEFEGMDRFRLRDGRAVDAQVAYDTGVLRRAVENAAASAAA